MNTSTLGGINRLPINEKLAIYSRLIPKRMLTLFNIPGNLQDQDGNELLQVDCAPGSSTTELQLYHQSGFPDPVLYGHITDTWNGLLHILLYVINDPSSPRFDIDRMPDGRPTLFGIDHRNIDAELAAMNFGLAPGQIRRGLRMLSEATQTFETFVAALGHDLFIAEPLYYHTAILFEQNGFAYEKGRRLMQRIQTGFAPGGDLLAHLDGSTPFRQNSAENSIRLRSWAIHDGILGEPFTNVTMYKRVGKLSGLSSCPGCSW
jgi:acetoin utilization protein AcuC